MTPAIGATRDLGSLGRRNDPYSELAQLLLRDVGRRARHRVDAGLVLRERDRVADAPARRAAPCDSRSIPEAIPPCGGAPIASASSRKPNFAPLLLGRDVEQPEDRLPGARARGSGTSRRRARCRCRRGRRRCAVASPGSVSSSGAPVLGRPRERVVHGVPALLVLVPLEHREVGAPRGTPTRRGRSARARGRGGAAARRARATTIGRLVGGEEHGRPGLGAERAPARPRRGTSRSASAPRRRRRRRGTRAPSRPTASRPPRASRARRARAPSARAGSARPRRFAKTPNSEPRVTSVASSISSPKRRSGLSEP